LPPALAGGSEKIDERARLGAEIAAPVRAGERRRMEEDAARSIVKRWDARSGAGE
jgi:hypothetical protein